MTYPWYAFPLLLISCAVWCRVLRPIGQDSFVRRWLITVAVALPMQCAWYALR